MIECMIDLYDYNVLKVRVLPDRQIPDFRTTRFYFAYGESPVTEMKQYAV